MKRIIIDCDPGIDDAQAIMMAYRHPDIEIEAITTVSGNVGVDLTTENALKVLDVLEAEAIPVIPGARTGLVEVGENASFVHGSDGLGDIGLPNSKRKPQSEHAALALIRLAMENPNEISLIAIGPLTNVALALRLEPELPAFFRQLVIMGGAYLGQGNTQNLPAEFNIYADPEAAKVVFESWPKLSMVSWEATVDHGFTFEEIQSLYDLQTTKSRFLEKVSEKITDFLRNELKSSMVYAADPLAMAVMLEPDIVLESIERFVQIETLGRLSRGMTVVDWSNSSGKPSNVKIIQKVDQGRFFQLFKMAFE